MTKDQEIKIWQSRLRDAIEQKEAAEAMLMELGVLEKATQIKRRPELVQLNVPTWYKKDEMYWYLIRNRYSKEIASELAQRWADDLQGAFKKGFEKGVQRNEGINIDAVYTDKAAPTPELVPEEWIPASERPDNIRDVWLKLSDGRELKGWCLDVYPRRKVWYIIYPDSKDQDIGEYIRPLDTVIGWKEIE